MEEKMRKGQFTLEDFLDQMRAMKKLGSLQSIVGMLPGGDQITSEQLDQQQKEFKRMEGIICAMTPQERRTPNLLNAKRRLRIANGSGVKVAEVNTLMNKFGQMQQMMKKIRQDAENDGPHGREDAGDAAVNRFANLFRTHELTNRRSSFSRRPRRKRRQKESIPSFAPFASFARPHFLLS